MDCTRVKKSLTKYLRHSAEPSVTQDVEEHLTICSSCRDHLERILETEGKRTMTKKLIPAAALIALILIILAAFHLRQASCGVKKENMPPAPEQVLSGRQEALTKALKGEWAAVFYDTFSGKNVPEEFSVKASFPQEEGTITLSGTSYHYFKVASVLDSGTLAKTISVLQKKITDPSRIVIAQRLNRYLASGAPASETSIVYFYALTPTN